MTWSDCTGFNTRKRFGGRTSSGRFAAFACGIGVANDMSTAMRAQCSAFRPSIWPSFTTSICRTNAMASSTP